MKISTIGIILGSCAALGRTAMLRPLGEAASADDVLDMLADILVDIPMGGGPIDVSGDESELADVFVDMFGGADGSATSASASTSGDDSDLADVFVDMFGGADGSGISRASSTASGRSSSISSASGSGSDSGSISSASASGSGSDSGSSSTASGSASSSSSSSAAVVVGRRGPRFVRRYSSSDSSDDETAKTAKREASSKDVAVLEQMAADQKGPDGSGVSSAYSVVSSALVANLTVAALVLLA